MLRPLFQLDLPHILEIENAVHIAPWTVETFETCLEAGCDGWVIENGGNIIGFVLISQKAQECHVLNLCVSKDYQGQGLGRMLLEHVIQNAKYHNMRIVYLEVRRSNTRAITLYKKMKFQLLAERKNYYPLDPDSQDGSSEDALIFGLSTRPEKKV